MSGETLILLVVQDANPHGSYSITYKNFAVFPHFPLATVQWSTTVLMDLTSTLFKPTGTQSFEDLILQVGLNYY